MPTLSTTLLLQDTLKAYHDLFPMIGAMGTDFNAGPLRLGDNVIAHIETLPTAADYDENNGGYENGATEGSDLLVDVPIHVDKHRHVPLKWSHLKAIQNQKKTYKGTVENAAFVLGREQVQSVFAKANAANVSKEAISPAADVDYEVLTHINGEMNKNGASPRGRIGVINTDIANALEGDVRITSKDFYGIQTGGNAYRVFRSIAGFQAIYEFPTLANNNIASGAVTATAATDLLTKAGHGFKNGNKVRFTTADTLPAPLAINTTYYVRDAGTDTFKLALTDGGAVIDITTAGTGAHAVAGYENLSGFFFEASAVALRSGVPEQTAEYAAELGIPQTMAMEILKNPESRMTLALMKWQKGGTGNLYVSPTAIWGSSVGRQGGAAGTITDRGAYRLVTG